MTTHPEPRAVAVHQARDPVPGWAEDVVRREAARLTGADPDRVTLSRGCPRCGSTEHGRPVVLEGGREIALQVSLSRTRGLTVLAVVTGGRLRERLDVRSGVRLGVDVEWCSGTDFDGFPEVALHPAERAVSARDRAVVWTRKESLLKALGTGLHVDPRTVRVSDADAPAGALELPAGIDVRSTQMTDLDLGPEHVGCVTVLAARRPQVRAEGAEGAEPSRAARP